MSATPAPTPPPSCLMQNYNRQDVAFVRGDGCYLEDAQGRRYLDAFAGVAVSVLGHGHPGLASAIAAQAKQLLHVSNHYQIVQQEELARVLIAGAFPGRVLFCNSGTEANECAYKIARLWGNQVHSGRKQRMVAFHGSFHGRTLGALSITANPAYREPFAPLPAAEFLPFGDTAALATIGDDVAGVFVEPIQGEGGINVPPPGFLVELRRRCTQVGALLVVDEIQTGAGRSGKLYCHQHDGITPDIMTLAKGLGGGVPIGAVVASEATAALLKPGLHGTTFGGNPLACAAGLTVMRELGNPALLANVTARSEQLMTGLRTLFAADAVAVRGKGLLIGVQLKEAPAPLIKAALAEGLVVGPSGKDVLRIAPPLIVTAAQIDELLTRLGAARQRRAAAT